MLVVTLSLNSFAQGLRRQPTPSVTYHTVPVGSGKPTATALYRWSIPWHRGTGVRAVVRLERGFRKLDGQILHLVVTYVSHRRKAILRRRGNWIRVASIFPSPSIGVKAADLTTTTTTVRNPPKLDSTHLIEPCVRMRRAVSRGRKSTLAADYY